MQPIISSLPAAPVVHRADHDLVTRLQKSEIFRDYQKAFQAATGLPLALRPTGSFQPPLHGSRMANPLCVLMASPNRSCSACLQLQQRVENAADGQAATIECFAGLSDSAVPIRVGERVVAYLQTGQVMLHAPSEIQFRHTTRQLGEWGVDLDGKRLREAYFNTRVMTRQQYDSVLRLLAIFAEHLSSISNQLMVKTAAAEEPAVAKARGYIAERQSEPVSLSEVARAVNMSAFYFCKVFKRATGLTFTEYLARVRVETVKQVLLDPHKRVSEAAYAAGFQSLSQFNRVFRRITGEAPSEYKERLHGSASMSLVVPQRLTFAA
jgi:AraC-like DNA-binding protein/ligand-binding sensor protein